MVMNGNFLEGHCKGFDDGVTAGWKAGYLRAMQDTGAAPVGPMPEPTGIEYVSPTGADLDESLKDLFQSDRISARAYHCLKKAGVYTVGDIARKSEGELGDIRNLGEKTINELKTLLADVGLALKDSSKAKSANV